MNRSLLLLLFSVLISCSPVRKYQKLPEVLSWENDIEKFEQLDRSEIYPGDALLFAGSSSIRLWTSLDSDMAPYTVIRRGYGGAKLSDFAVYAGRIIVPHKCRAIVLFIGNDIMGGKDDKSPREVGDLFLNILKTIRKTHPGTPVFWIAITPTPSRWSAWTEIEKANSGIRNICGKKKNTYFIPTDFAFLDEDGKPRRGLFMDDMLHLNRAGYAVWTEIIKKELMKVVPVKN
jgi:lysophospholipase L1-like esterase